MYQNIYYHHFTRTLHVWDDQEGYIMQRNVKNYGYVADSNGEYESIDGTRVRKEYDIPKDWHEQGIVYEGKVPMTTRSLIDIYTDDDTPSTGHRTINIDIEVAKEGSYSKPEHANNTITAITMCHMEENKYYTLILDPKKQIETGTYKLSELCDPDDVVEVDMDVNVWSCLDEHALLRNFSKLYTKLAPTILTGWNIKGYDIPYLINRLNRVLGGSRANVLSPIGICEIREFRGEVIIEIAGVSILDYIDLYKKFTYSEQSSYSLNNISLIELKRGKIEYDGSLDTLFSTNLRRFIYYNIVDVVLVGLLDAKLDFINIARGLCHKGHTKYEDIFFTSRYMDGAILTHIKRMGKVAARTNKISHEGKAEGAYVKIPIPGIYKWVYDLDLTSLYPSNIISLNISPETKYARITNWTNTDFTSALNIAQGTDECVYNLYLFRTGLTIDLTTQQLRDYAKEHNLSIAGNGVMYDKTVPGILPQILIKWFDERVEYNSLASKYHADGDENKFQFYDRQQLIQKILLNSLYGVLLLPPFRWYDRDNGEAVTLSGQQVSWFTRICANKFYADIIGEEQDYCIYGDTDSVFFPSLPLINKLYPDATEEDIPDLTITVADMVQRNINSMYDYYAEAFHNLTVHRWNIKQELVAKSAFWGEAKKRYAMWIVRKKGRVVDEPDIKGFDVVKSDFPVAFKVLMTEVLHGILHGTSAIDLNRIIAEKITHYVETDILQMLKPTGVSDIGKWVDSAGNAKKGAPVHVKSAINYNKLLTLQESRDYPRIENGDKLMWCYVKTNAYNFDTMALPSGDYSPEIYEFLVKNIDIDKITERTLIGKLQTIWDSLEWGNLILKNKIFKYFKV